MVTCGGAPPPIHLHAVDLVAMSPWLKTRAECHRYMRKPKLQRVWVCASQAKQHKLLVLHYAPMRGHPRHHALLVLLMHAIARPPGTRCPAAACLRPCLT